MTHQAPPVSPAAGADPGRQLAQLREALRLVERIAGRASAAEAGLDEAAKLSAAYDRALPVAQRRFDALRRRDRDLGRGRGRGVAGRGRTAPPRAAAARLADSLETSARRSWSSRSARARQARLEIGDQIVRILEADMEPHQRPAIVRLGRGPHRIGGDDKALIAAPAIADPEQLQRVDQPRARRIVRRSSTKEKSPVAPLKSRFQNSWPGQSGKAG